MLMGKIEEDGNYCKDFMTRDPGAYLLTPGCVPRHTHGVAIGGFSPSPQSRDDPTVLSTGLPGKASSRMLESCPKTWQGNLFPSLLVLPPVSGGDDQKERAGKKPSRMHSRAEISAVPPAAAPLISSCFRCFTCRYTQRLQTNVSGQHRPAKETVWKDCSFSEGWQASLPDSP